jgi:cysteine desulfurase
MKVYLDNAATTPLAPEVLEAMMPYLTENFGNPSSSHAFGRKTKTAIEAARRTIAQHLHCTPGEIYFTSGGTEADNLAMTSAIMDLGCKHIITSRIEHSAVIKTAQHLSEKHQLQLSLVDLTADGSVDMEHLEVLLATHGRSFVSLMHANNEIGNMISLQDVGQLCAKYNAIFHSDTVQTMGHYPIHTDTMNIHFLNASAHKFHGPKGVGFIYINKNIKINATITGGGQERGMRGGTENLYGIVGMSKALDVACQHMDEHAQHVREVKNYMMQRLQETIPNIIFNGRSKENDSLYTVLNFTLPESENSDMMLFLLDLDGVACSGGSACSSGAAKGSHVLDGIQALRDHCASLRFSFSRYSTKAEVDYALEKIKDHVQVATTA